MEIIENPDRNKWDELCLRAEFDTLELKKVVQSILNDVKARGDKAVIDYAKKFDHFQDGDTLRVRKEEFENAKKISEELKEAIHVAYRNIKKFHTQQFEPIVKIETTKGVICWRKNVPISKIGLYIPGGTAPLYSTLLMLGIPAVLAGCKEIIVCTPPNTDGTLSPILLYIFQLLDIQHVFKIGGAQAIGAMTYGTKKVSKVSKIFGPGNQYVTMAKQLVQTQGMAIDMPAGPSELLIISGHTAKPNFVASDILSQLEHGIDSQVILLSNCKKTIDEIKAEMRIQLQDLERKNIIIESLKNSKAILFNTPQEMIDFSNHYAPEHVILASDNADQWADKIENAGSVFIGHYSSESLGDYASGTNHTLPTNGFAKAYSGVSIDSFVKKITFQQVSKEGIKNIGPAVEKLAGAEGLTAHEKAVSIRLKEIQNG